MVNLELTEDHKAIRKTVRDFALSEVAPRIRELDEKQEFDRSILDKMAQLNLLGVCIPEEYGGAGFDYISLGMVGVIAPAAIVDISRLPLDQVEYDDENLSLGALARLSDVATHPDVTRYHPLIASAILASASG